MDANVINKTIYTYTLYIYILYYIILYYIILYYIILYYIILYYIISYILMKLARPKSTKIDNVWRDNSELWFSGSPNTETSLGRFSSVAHRSGTTSWRATSAGFWFVSKRDNPRVLQRSRCLGNPAAPGSTATFLQLGTSCLVERVQEVALCCFSFGRWGGDAIGLCDVFCGIGNRHFCTIVFFPQLLGITHEFIYFC